MCSNPSLAARAVNSTLRIHVVTALANDERLSAHSAGPSITKGDSQQAIPSASPTKPMAAAGSSNMKQDVMLECLNCKRAVSPAPSG